MLHPNQFQVNEAWIAFQLNDLPIETMQDGSFNCIALMDAASCFIVGDVFMATTAAATRAEAKRRGITVVPVEESQLVAFTGEARRGFKELVQSGGGREA